jgi:hypothetical protein
MLFSALVLNAGAQNNQLTGLLTSYYGMKDALVAGKPASGAADSFIKVLNGIDYKLISEGNVNTLLKDATAISQSREIKDQRVYFSNLSNNMISLLGSLKIGTDPVYKVYCPMKKAYWLSSVNEVRNPYYGSSMLTCGKVVETLNQ